jgi:hypothetical protein
LGVKITFIKLSVVQFSVQGLHIVVEESANMSGQDIIFFLQQIQQEPYSFTPHMFRSPILPSLESFLMKKYKGKKAVCHIVALPFTLKSILMQKKNYGNSDISPCKNIIFKKIL